MGFKILIPEHVLLGPRSLSLNTYASVFADKISVEEGWGMQGNDEGYGCNFSVSNHTGLICNTKRVNSFRKKFNRQ